MAWFTFVIQAAVPSSSPSMSVNSQRGAGAVERRHAHRFEELEQLSLGARRRTRVRRRWYERSKSGSMTHIGIVTGHRGLDHALPERDDEPGDSLVGLDQPVPVGRAIEDEQSEERRPRVRVGFAPVHQRVEGFHRPPQRNVHLRHDMAPSLDGAA